MRRTSRVVVYLILMVSAGGATAQPEQGLSWSGETGLFSLFTAVTLPHGEWSFGLSYNNWDRRVTRADRPTPGLSHRWGYDHDRIAASAGYGLRDDLELALSLPYESLEGARFNRIGTINGREFRNRIDAEGLGNVRLGAKWRPFEGGWAGSALALDASLELPTGDEDDGVVTGGPALGLTAVWDFGDWVFNARYRDLGDADDADVSNELTAGIGYSRTLQTDLEWLSEVMATLHLGGPEPDAPDSFDLTSGGRFWFGDRRNWAASAAVRIELNQLFDSNGYSPLGGLLMISYRPQFRRQVTGACCRPSGDCTEETAEYCAYIGGWYRGDGSSCEGDEDGDGDGLDDSCWRSQKR